MADLGACSEVADVLPGSFAFAALKSYEGFKRCKQASTAITYCIDNELVYEPFFADFGPLNLGSTHQFCQRTAELVQEARRQKRQLIFYCGPHPQMKANAAVLVGAFLVLNLGMSGEEAYQCLRHLEPFVTFRDASSGPSCFGLSVASAIQGLARAKKEGFLSWETFDALDYEHIERVENGDANWILPGKLLAFSGPLATAESFYGYKTKVPEDYWEYFRRKHVSAVVRLNKPMYKASRFTAGGFRHYDLYFPDGSCPSETIIKQFLSISELEGALAIHCKAGLGRTGVLICCYLMKHHNFTPLEALGYIRICRPGSVIGPQQNFVVQQGPSMAAQGEHHRRTNQIQPARPVVLPRQIHARAKTSQQSSVQDKRGPMTFKITASCQVASPLVQPIINAAPTLGVPTQPTTSRLSFLRFKAPSFKGLTGRTTVARAVAPNGQPRKIPTAMLAAGEQGLRTFAEDEEQPQQGGWTITASPEVLSSVYSPLGNSLKHM